MGRAETYANRLTGRPAAASQAGRSPAPRPARAGRGGAMTRRWIAMAMSAGLVLASVVGCTDDDGTEANRAPKTSEDKPVVLRAGAASRSILPTVDGDRKFLDDA